MICQCCTSICIWCNYDTSIIVSITRLICSRSDILEGEFCRCSDTSEGKFILLQRPDLFRIHLRIKFEASFYSCCTGIQKLRINRKNHFIIFNFIRTCFCTTVVKVSLTLVY